MIGWLQQFMVGRYGPDGLSVALLVAGMVFSFTARITGSIVLLLLSFLAFGLILFRFFSRNTERRSQENQRFMGIFYRIKDWFTKKSQHIQDSKTHCFFKCPTCSQNLRVPRGKGKITITCPKCNTQFTKKT